MKTVKVDARRNTLRAVAGVAFAATALLGSGAVLAQAYPNKPVKLVVTYPAGGSSD